MSGQPTPPATAPQMTALAEWAAGHRTMVIPPAVYRQATIVLCDDLAARKDPTLVKMCDQMLRDGGKPVAAVFRGARPRIDRYNAAVANGAAGPWSKLDEGSLRVSCHAGIYALPALVAEAEAEGLSCRETPRCLAVAYEVLTRLALAFSQPTLVLHPHASLSAVGAAAAVAVALRYDGGRFLDTLTLAPPWSARDLSITPCAAALPATCGRRPAPGPD